MVRPFSTALQFIIRGQPPFLRLWRPRFSLLWASRVSRAKDIFIHEKKIIVFLLHVLYVHPFELSEMEKDIKILKI